jgi:hypothetical protein
MNVKSHVDESSPENPFTNPINVEKKMKIYKFTA